jgi:hypothetical protein
MPSVSPFLLAWDRIPVRANTIFCPFPPSISFLLYIQTFFYTNMNIFINLLENLNKSRTSANNLSLKQHLETFFLELNACKGIRRHSYKDLKGV